MVKTCYIPKKLVNRTHVVHPKWSVASMHYNDRYICHKHTMNPVFKTKNFTPPLSPNLKKKIVLNDMHYKVNESLSTSHFSYRPQVQIYKGHGQHLDCCECHLAY